MAQRRLLVAGGAGLAMSFLIWVLVGDSSPIRELANQEPAFGHVLMLLNMPALLMLRMLGTLHETPLAVLCLVVFLQWFAIGYAASFLIWPAKLRSE